MEMGEKRREDKEGAGERSEGRKTERKERRGKEGKIGAGNEGKWEDKERWVVGRENLRKERQGRR